MTPELLDGFVSSVQQAMADPSLRCIVITGSGNCFSAGADFKSQLQASAPGAMPHERSYMIYEPFLSVLDIKVPVIAAMNGHAVGGGFGLALTCDIRIAHQNSKYGANFTKLGISPGMGLSESLPSLVGYSKAAELLFGGDLISGEEALRIGLVSSIHRDHVLERALECATRIAASAPIALRLTKGLLHRQRAARIRDAAYVEALTQAPTLSTEDAKEGMDALLQKRDPVFHGVPT